MLFRSIGALAQGVANMPYNILGAPGDLGNLLALPTGRQPFYGSESAKDLATRLGIRPPPPTDPTQALLYGAGDIGSALASPASVATGLSRKALQPVKQVPETLRIVEKQHESPRSTVLRTEEPAPQATPNIQPVQTVPMPDGRFATTTQLSEVKQIRTGYDTLDSPGAVAHLTAGLRKSPQEQLVAVVADANNKPLQVIRHTIGLSNQASAEPFSLVGAVANVPGARSFWLSHNHPSGSTGLSSADIRLAEAVQTLTRDTGLDMRGILSIGGGKFGFSDLKSSLLQDVPIPPRVRDKTVTMSERTFRRSGVLDNQGINGPADAVRMADQIAGDQTGVILMNGQLQPVGFMPIKEAELMNLRKSGESNRLLAAMERANAPKAMLVSKKPLDNAAIGNVSSLFEMSGVDLVDVIDGPQRQSLMSTVGRIPPAPVFKTAAPIGAGLTAAGAMSPEEGFAQGGPVNKHDAFISRKMKDGGDVSRETISPEEQPVTEESSTSRALKRLIEPVREGAKGFLGMEPTEPMNPSEAYKALQALGNMPGPAMAKGAVKALTQVPGLLEGVATSIFIGPRAAQWNKATNKTAQAMEKAGVSPEEIWSKTMNFRAPDGKWRQEISDVPAAMKQGPDQGHLEQFVHHPDLYKNYPDLLRLEVTKDLNAPTSSYSPVDDSILLNQKDSRYAPGALHEVQHAVQTRENFAMGGNPAMAFKNKEAFDILKRKRKELGTLHTLEEYAKKGWQTDTVTPEVKAAYREYLKWRKSPKTIQDVERAAQKSAADEYYMRLHGEAEARAVSSRKPLDMEQRRQLFPLESYTLYGRVIPPQDLIIKRKEGGPVNKHDAFIKAKA